MNVDMNVNGTPAASSPTFAGRTWTVGEVFYVPASLVMSDYYDTQAVRVAKVDRFGAPEFCAAGDHVNARGRVVLDGQVGCGTPQFNYDFSEEQDREFLASALTGAAPTSLVRVTRVVTASGERSYMGRTSGERRSWDTNPRPLVIVHAANAAGQPVCGSKVVATETNPVRWDPWVRVSMPADTRTSVYLPSFQTPTCAKCAARAA